MKHIASCQRTDWIRDRRKRRMCGCVEEETVVDDEEEKEEKGQRHLEGLERILFLCHNSRVFWGLAFSFFGWGFWETHGVTQSKPEL